MKLLDGFSVIICCYNSEKRLPNTLAHLAKQTFSGEWELIIVDNNCTDNTVTVAQNEWKKYNHRVALRIISETQPGLSHARRAGILNAKYKYAIFCDDDNWLDENYLKIAYKIMESHPDVGLLGGQSKEVCEIEPPEWFDKVKHNYAIGKQAEKSGYLLNRYFLWGSGMVLRTQPAMQLYNAGLKNLLVDRKKNSLSSGGDSELSCWFFFLDYKLFYDENLFFFHFVPKERLTEAYYSKLEKELSSAYEILQYYFNTIIFFEKNTFSRLIFAAKTIIKLLLSILFKKYKNQYLKESLVFLLYPFYNRGHIIYQILKTRKIILYLKR